MYCQSRTLLTVANVYISGVALCFVARGGLLVVPPSKLAGDLSFALYCCLLAVYPGPPQSYDYPISLFQILVCRIRISTSLSPEFSLSDCLSYLHMVHNTEKTTRVDFGVMSI